MPKATIEATITTEETKTIILDSLEEIHDVETLIVLIEAFQNRLKDITVHSACTWKIGDKVQLIQRFHHRKPYNTIGTIIKINKKNIKIDFGIYKIWKISKTVLLKVEE